LIDQQMLIFRSTDKSRPSSRGYRFVLAIYLLAIVAATFGWLWLIAWIALQLI
jgi:fatty acid desaturase